MASPMQALRKYQKSMMVVFCSLLMVAFILQTVITTNFGRPDEVEPVKKISVAWDGQSYSYDDLQRFRRLHNAAEQYIFTLVNDSLQKGATIRIDPTLIQTNSQLADNYLDEATILLLADEARRNGIIVGDAAVTDFLNEISEGFTDEDHQAELDRLFRGGVSLPQLKAHLATELAAIRMSECLLSGIGGTSVGRQGPLTVRQSRSPFITPVSAVAAERRTNDTAKVQMLAIDVEPFLDQVKDSPSQSEIRRLYAAGSTMFEDLMRERPGFRLPDQARVQWIQITPDMTNPPVDSITDAQVQAEYDRRVAARELSVSAVSPTIPPSDNPLIPPVDTPLIPPANEGEGTEGTNPETPATETPATEAPGTETPATETPATDPPATETPASETPATGGGEPSSTEPATPETPAGGGQTSLISPTQFVSATQDEPATTEPATQEPAATETPATETPAATEAPAQEPANVEAPAAEVPTTEPAAQDPAVPPSTQDIQIPSGTPATPGEFVARPLDDELKAKIREDLSREIGRKRREEITLTILDRLKDHAGDVASHVAEIEAGVVPADAEGPAAPEFKKWVDEFGVAFGDSEGLVDQAKLSDLPIGQQFAMIDFNQMQNFNQFPTVDQILFANGIESVMLYEPQEVLGGGFIYWVSEKSPSHIPTLEACQNDIIRYWRWNKALELAQADAKKKLDAVGANQTLKDVYPEAQASSSFSYWSVGGGNVGMFQGQRPTLSPIPIENPAVEGEETPAAPERVTDIGHEFMRAIFGAAAGEKVVAPNARHDKVYAIQVVELNGMLPLSETAVMNQTAPSMMANAVVGSDMQQFTREWITELMSTRNVRWSVSE